MIIYGEIKNSGVVDVICDRCSKSTKNTNTENLGYAALEAWWPYGSAKDLEHHQLHVCESCYDWLRDLLKANGVEIRVETYLIP